MQGAAELGQFLQPGGHAAAQRVDQRTHHGFGAAAVGLTVGGDEALVDTPGDQHWQMVVIGENSIQSGLLASVKQRVSGAQGTPGPVERIPGAAAVPAGGLLDALAAQIQLGAAKTRLPEFVGIFRGRAE